MAFRLSSRPSAADVMFFDGLTPRQAEVVKQLRRIW